MNTDGPYSVSFSTNSGTVRNTVLKSFVGRSFRNTMNSGAGSDVSLQVLMIASMMLPTMDSVFGPEEHPRSAMARVFGFSEM